MARAAKSATNRTILATVVAVLVAASGLLLAPSAATAAKPEIAVADLDWHDGLNHFVLTPTSLFTDAPASPVEADQDSKSGVTVPTGSVFGTSRDGRPTAITPDGRIVFLDDPTQKIETSTIEGTDAIALVGGAEGKERSDAFAELVRGWPGIVDVSPMSGGMVAVATSLSREEVERQEAVARVDDDHLLQMASLVDGRPNDPRFGLQWMHDNTGDSAQAGGYAGLVDADTDAPLAWARSTGRGVVVADIDSGVDIDHPDLAANIWRNSDETCGNGVDDDGNGYVDDCVGWDAADNDSNPRPTGTGSFGAHGTHVAGIIAAAGDNGIGVVGVAPDAKVMAIKIGSGNGIAASSILTATMYAVDNGAKIINASWGTPPGTPRAGAWLIEQAVRYASERGVLFVVAAGNDGVNIDLAPTWPASFANYYDNVLAIGASTNRDKIASFSNDGLTLGTFAPGWFIESTLPGNSYGMMSGTSMAAPVVSGAAAILVARNPEKSVGWLRDVLPAYADDVDVRDGTSGRGGRLNVASLVGVGVSVFSVEYRDFNAFVPDVATDVELGFHLNDPGNVGANTKLLLTMVTPEGGHFYAPSGLEMDVTIAGQRSRVVTDDTGTVVLKNGFNLDEIAIASDELPIGLSMALPAGNYAMQVQLIDTILPNLFSSALYFIVGSSGVDDEDSSSGGGSSSESDGGGGSSSGSGGSSGGGTSGGSSSGGGSSGGTSDGSTGSEGSGGSGGASSGGGSSTGEGSSNGGTSSGGSGTSSGGGGGSSSGSGTEMTTGTTLVASPPSDESGSGSGQSAGGGNSSDGTSGGGGSSGGGGVDEPLDPVQSGDWLFADMSPRSGSTAGGTTVMINGIFPDYEHVRVTFGGTNGSILWAGRDAIYVQTPSHAEGVVDVTVAAVGVVLTAHDAFTYVAPGGSSSSSGSTGGSTGGTSGGSGGGGSTGGSSGSSGESSGGSTGGSSGSTGGSSGGGSSGGGSSGGSNGPGSTIVDQPESPPPPSVVRRGSLTLRLVSVSQLTSMAVDAFPDRACKVARCGGELL